MGVVQAVARPIVLRPSRMVRDKWLGLKRGPEVLANPGNPFTALTEWGSQSGSATLALADGAIVGTRASNASAWMIQDQAIALTAGKAYEVVADVASPDGKNIYINLFDLTASGILFTSNITTSAARTTLRAVVTANNTGNYLFNVGMTAADPVGTRAILYAASVRQLY